MADPSQPDLTALDIRAAIPSDAEALALAVIDGLQGYRSFARPGWSPPPLSAEVETLRGLLNDEQAWCRLAESHGRVVGQVTVLPAARAVHQVDDPDLAHLRNLFVREDLWGTGLAGRLQSAALDAATARGFLEMRLFTPAGHARAKRFYEREGWTAAGEEFEAPGLDLVLIEYRRALT